MKNATVRDIMSTKLKTLHPKDKLRRAKDIFNEYHIHHIPVQVMKELRGIISLGDILYLEGVVTNSFDEFIKNKKLDTLDVEEVMTKKPYCIEASMPLTLALDVMINKRINALPVVENNNELVGIVTAFDMMKCLKSELLEN
ncbi:MAG: CBS domain-containing protein [Saprospiraceae bacterium]|nr:CBS domain-containing protein [Bacteroidia bacterium]NNE14692.1 CBS domain-containing protein [Saprospiraceae bacterium]NNL91006.1 CBS domain-containing protein [Saprospiraceae bacterium]